jgi:WD40 repeat protein
MPAIFISHSSKDPKIAGEMMAELARLGFERVFLDFDKTSGIGAGSNWEKKLYEELSRCHAVILMLTPDWLASKWCFVELAQARALGKVILPVLCAPLGEQVVLPEVQAVDLVDWNPDGLGRLEQRLRAITNELARGFTLDPDRPPYPGINAFEPEDAAIYFGRDEETRAVIERLDARRTQGGARFVIIIGASGSGKSSLLKASVLPQLGRRRAQWITLPVIRPEKAPLEALAKAFAQHAGKPEDWRAWHETLTGSDAVAAIERLTQDVRIGDGRAATVLLPVDQFEEVFTTTGAAERTAFLTLLAAAFDRDIPFMVVATGRSDVLEGLVESSELVHRYEPYPLAAMPLERVPRLIEGPAAVAGINIERGLPERIVRDVESAEALPLFAHMLSLLYQRGGDDKKLTIAEYDALGDPARGLNPIQNSVRLAADEAIARVRPNEPELAALRDAFVQLVRVRLGDAKRVRQPARMSELPQESQRLIRALVEARLLSTRGTEGSGSERGETVVEVTHEALFQAWPTLDRWLTDEQAFLSDLERIRSAHEIWAQTPADQQAGELLSGLLLSRAREWLAKYPQRFAGRDLEPLRRYIAASAQAADAEAAREATREARARRMQQWLLRGAVAASVVFLAIAAVAFWQYVDAERQRVAAQEAKTTAERSQQAAEQSQREAVAQRDSAERERRRADESRVEALAQKDRAEDERKRAEAQRNQALTTQARFLTDLARQRYDAHDYATALALALEALPDERRGIVRPYVAAAESMLYQAVTALRERYTLKAPNPLAVSPDGSRIVTASENTARVWDAATGDEVGVLKGHTDKVRSAAFSRDGTHIVTASRDKTARVWNAATGAEKAALSGPVDGAEFSPDGRSILTTSLSDKTARRWDVATGRAVVLKHPADKAITAAAFSPDGQRIATASTDMTTRLWNANGAPGPILRGHTGPVRSVAFAPDGRLIVTGSDDKTVRIWDATSGRSVATFRGHEHGVAVARFASDSRRVLSHDRQGVGIWDVTVRENPDTVTNLPESVWDAQFSPDGGAYAVATGKTVRIMQLDGSEEAFLAHPDEPVSVTFSPDGRQIVTVARDGLARVWDATPAGPVRVLHGAGAHAKQRRAAFAPDGRRILVDLEDVTPQILDLASGSSAALPGPAAPSVSSAAFGPDGSRVVVVLDGGIAQVRDAAQGSEIAALKGHAGELNFVAFAPDGKWIVTASADSTARVWDAATGAQLIVFRRHEGKVATAVFSPDGTRVVTASADRTARVWDAATGAALVVLEGHESEVATAVFSPDGKRVATSISSLEDGAVILWDAASGAELRRWDTPKISGAAFGAAFSPDGRRILTAFELGSARVSDVDTGEEVAVLRGGRILASGAFSPDGRWMMTAPEETGAAAPEVRLWPAFATTHALIDHARAVMPRELTPEQRKQFFLDLAPGAASRAQPAR